jgi:hypothetical protein
MRAPLHLFIAALMGISGAAKADDESCPKSSTADMDSQWNRYASQSRAQPFDTDGQFDCLFVPDQGPIVCRTRPGHLAHPSLIIRRLVMNGGSLDIRMQAYTAADCAAFAQMMYQAKVWNDNSVSGKTNNGLATRP